MTGSARMRTRPRAQMAVPDDARTALSERGYQLDGSEFLTRRPDRLTVGLRTGEGTPAVGKLHPAGGGADAFRNMCALWESSFGERRDPPGLARPIEYIEEPEVLVMEHLGDVLIAVKPHLASLRERFGGTVVPQPVDTELFDPNLTDRERARYDFGFDGPTVLFPGVPRRHKGVELLADVIAIPQLDDKAAHHQMPLKAADAMAMARPIVASAVSDLPDVLDGCGRLVPADDGAALAAAIGDLLDDGAQARELGDRARARCVERYSFEPVGEQLAGIVGSVARTPAPQPLPVGIGA